MNDTARFIEGVYEGLAVSGASSLCCSPVSLYTREELASLPDEVLLLSSGCGHPVSDAEITPGMVVLDIGSGAGADCMLAARLVGPSGQVIGVDPSPTMRATATAHRDKSGLNWIDYRQGTSDQLPAPSHTIDVVTSNCVLSLSTQPASTWTEIARVLRPGGHAVVSDIVGGHSQTPQLAQAKCETGLEWTQYRATLRASGFTGIRILRVREASFRDGATAQSVTFDARRDSGRRHVAVDVLHDDSHLEEAENIVRELVAVDATASISLAVRRIDVSSPRYRDIADFLGCIDLSGVRVAVDGQTAPVHCPRGSVLNGLLDA